MAVREIKTTLVADGEQEFKRALRDAAREMAVLGSEARANTAAFGENANSMSALQSRSQSLSKMVEQQKHTVSALAQAVENSASQYGEADKRTDEYRIKLNNANASLSKMENELEGVNKDLGDYGANALKAAKDTDEFKAAQDRINGSLGALKIGLGAVAGVAVGLGAAFAKAGLAADDLNTLSKVSGLSTAELQKFQYATDLIDVSMETLTGSMTKLTRNMDSARRGTKTTQEAFEALGVSYKDDVTGQLRNGQDVFDEVITALGQIENETERDAKAMAILGKSAKDLNPLILGGADALRELGNDAERAGLILSQDALDGLNQINDSVDTFKARLKAGGMAILSQFAGPVNDALGKINFDKVTADVMKFFTFIKDNGRTIVSVIAAVGAGFVAWNVASIIMGAVQAIQIMTGATQGLTVAQTAFNAAANANPIGLIITAAVAAGAAIAVLTIAMNKTANEMRAIKDESESLTATSARLNEQVAANARAYDDSMTSMQAETKIAKDLVKEIEDLAAAEGKDAKQKALLESKVKQLNNIVPNLNLAYDAQAGALTKTADEMERVIELKETSIKQQAAEQRMIDLEKERLALEDQLLQLENQRAKAAEARSALEWNPLDAVGYAMAVEDSRKAIEGLDAQLLETNTGLENNAASYANAKSSAEGYATATVAAYETVLESERQLTEEEKKLAEERAQAMESSYDRYAASAQNAFSKIKDTVKISVKDMISNLDSNATRMEEWTENLNKLAPKLDSGLMEAIRKAGPEAAGLVKKLVSASDTEITELNTAFKRGGAAAREAMLAEFGLLVEEDPASKAVTAGAESVQQNESMTVAYKTMIDKAAKALADEIILLDFPGMGRSTTDGIAKGIRDGTADVVSAITQMARDAVAAAKRELDIHSPSGVGRREIGRQYSAGVALGILDGLGDVRRAVADLTDFSRGTGRWGSIDATGGGAGAARGRSLTIQLYPQQITDAEVYRLVGIIDREFGMAVG